MPELRIQEVSEVVNGRLVNSNKNIKFVNFHFDTRLVDVDNTLFFALKSENNDGHKFVRHLPDRKGIAAVVSKDFNNKGICIPLIKVDEPLKAAHQLASYVRKKQRDIKYVGVTGSAGKTTTKEFIYQLISRKYKTYRSFENWNNWIGLPFSILKMRGDEQIAVFELAMSYPGIGEIDLLSEILRPDIAVILNIFPVHLEFLKNLENIARAKSEILNYLSSDDVAFITGDSEHIVRQCRLKKGKQIYFGRNLDFNDIILKEIVRDGTGTRILIDFFGIETEFFTDIINKIHIENIFAAIIISQYLGLKNFEIQNALKRIKPLSNRGVINNYKNFTTIDETYNSNPEALKKTLHWVDKEYQCKKIAVIGDMLELGEKETVFHYDVGKFFSKLSFDVLITVGKRALKIADGAVEGGFDFKNIKKFENSRDAGMYLKKTIKTRGVFLFKASRGIKLEETIKEFLSV